VRGTDIVEESPKDIGIMNMIGKPKRLDCLFQNYVAPVYFITAVTAGRRPLLASEAIHEALGAYAMDNVPNGRTMGRYVIMPDHLHFFVRLAPESKISDYVRWLKTAITRCLTARCNPDLQSQRIPDPRSQCSTDLRSVVHEGFVWQPGFFDHVMRSRESYAQKWEYVRMNPVRAGLVDAADKWPFQGEIERIEM